MVTTQQILPAPLLRNFVHCYALRIFTTEDYMVKPLHAQPEYYLSFFLRKDKSWKLTENNGKVTENNDDRLSTLFSESNGYLSFKGSYNLFSVQFKANGLFAILGVPQKILLNGLFPVNDILGNDCRSLKDQLEYSNTLQEMSAYMNAYLTKKLLSRKHAIHSSAIAETATSMIRNKGLASIDSLAYYANMSLRNYERRFVNEVGIPPKLYMRVIRFYNAVENKMANPAKSWTEISYETGYFDQAHFIKECKEFSSKTPEALFKVDPPPVENYLREQGV